MTAHTLITPNKRILITHNTPRVRTFSRARLPIDQIAIWFGPVFMLIQPRPSVFARLDAYKVSVIR